MVRAIMIVEMAGRPATHLTESLEKHIGILNDVEDIEVHSVKVSVPQEIPSQDGEKVPSDQVMFTAFAEADFETENFARLTQTMFDFMPSSVEVIEPSKINMSSIDATDLLNNISGRMHRYDEVAKIAGARLQQMGAQLQGAQKVLMEKDAEIEDLKKKIPVKKKVTEKKKTAPKTKKTNGKKTANKK